MNRRLLKRFILGSVVLAVVIPGGLVYQRYQHDMPLAYHRVSGGGKMIETACGPIEYTEFGEGPMTFRSNSHLGKWHNSMHF